jgi:bacterioferritin
MSAETVKKEFLEHAQEAQQHADSIAERIVELNGEPDFNPETLTGRSLSQYTNARTLYEMIKEDLVAERIAVESYFRGREMAWRARRHQSQADG